MPIIYYVELAALLTRSACGRALLKSADKQKRGPMEKRRDYGGVLIETAIALPFLVIVLGGIVTLGLAYKEKVLLVESSRMAARVISHKAEIDAALGAPQLDLLKNSTTDAVRYWFTLHNLDPNDFAIDIQIFKLKLSVAPSAPYAPFVRVGIKSASPLNLFLSHIALAPCIETVTKARVVNFATLPEIETIPSFCGS